MTMQPSPGGGVRLVAQSKRRISYMHRRSNLGAYLEFRNNQIVYRPTGRQRGWSVPVGGVCGVSEIVHLTGSISGPYGVGMSLDRFVLVTGEGSSVALSIPSKSAFASESFPAQSVENWARSVGLNWREETVATAWELVRHWPGIVPGAQIILFSKVLILLLMAGFGIVFISLGIESGEGFAWKVAFFTFGAWLTVASVKEVFNEIGSGGGVDRP